MAVYVSALSANYLPKTGTPPPPQEAASLVLDSKFNKIYFYGGRSVNYQIDVYEFDLKAREWGKLSNSSWMSPGSRSNNFITMREESREIVIFGGDSDGGPTSDVWAYNIEDETVKST
jgi:hypothetical protein